MTNFLLALGVYVFLFVLLLASVMLGYRFGVWHKTQTTSQHNLGIVKVAEGTVFALLGLLVAFSFSGAYDRFENRKLKIIDEINSIKTAYHRVDLLAPSVQVEMRTLIKHYTDERLATYQRLAEFQGFTTELTIFRDLQDDVWAKAMQAVHVTANTATTLLFVQSINNMFEIGNTRILITRLHPPVPIFMLLIGLGALSSFLAGYSMAKNQHYSRVYSICFVAITAFTLYVIIDLEFPRIGMIRVDAFDHLLQEARDGLK